MSKYVIDTTLDNVKKVIAMGVTKGGAIWTDTTDIENLEELNSDYINEHFGSLQDDAYKRGLEDGKKATFGLVADASNAEYQKGLNDAWECARKIVEMADPPYWGVFNEYKNDLFRKISAAEAIAKLKSYEEKQKDKIEVGDEVKPFYTDITGVVTLIDGDTIYVLWRDGSSTSAMKLKEVTKTGRHFDIASILEEMRHD